MYNLFFFFYYSPDVTTLKTGTYAVGVNPTDQFYLIVPIIACC